MAVCGAIDRSNWLKSKRKGDAYASFTWREATTRADDTMAHGADTCGRRVVCAADHVFHGGSVGRVTDWITIVTGDRRLGEFPQRVVCKRGWAVLQINRRFTGRAVKSAVAGESSRCDADRGAPQPETGSRGCGVSLDHKGTVVAASYDFRDGGERFGPPSSPRSEDAPDRRFGRRHPQCGRVERLSTSLVLTLAASLMAIACVVTLA